MRRMIAVCVIAWIVVQAGGLPSATLPSTTLPATILPATAGGGGCTVLYATDGEQMLGGNNEDYYNPLTKVWFVPGEGGSYGRVYFGFDDYHPQGGMNEQGLFFDGLGLDTTLPVPTEGKEPYAGNLADKAMAECATVECVVGLFERYYAQEAWYWQFLFGDATGESAIVEAQAVLRQRGGYQVATNFLQSSTPPERRTCWRYQTAVERLEGLEALSVEAMRDLLDAVHQGGPAHTLYSNVYDLANRRVYLYHFHNYDDVVVLDPAALQAPGLDPAALQAPGLDPAALQAPGLDPAALQAPGLDPAALQAPGLDPAAELARGTHAYDLPALFPPNPEADAWAAPRLGQREALIASRQDPDLAPAALDAYAGAYELPAGWGAPGEALTVIAGERSLWLRFPDHRQYELFPEGDDTFFHVAFQDGAFAVAYQVTFGRDGEGRVATLEVAAGGEPVRMARIEPRGPGAGTPEPTPTDTAQATATAVPTDTPTPRATEPPTRTATAVALARAASTATAAPTATAPTEAAPTTTESGKGTGTPWAWAIALLVMVGAAAGWVVVRRGR